MQKFRTIGCDVWRIAQSVSSNHDVVHALRERPTLCCCCRRCCSSSRSPGCPSKRRRRGHTRDSEHTRERRREEEGGSESNGGSEAGVGCWPRVHSLTPLTQRQRRVRGEKEKRNSNLLRGGDRRAHFLSVLASFRYPLAAAEAMCSACSACSSPSSSARSAPRSAMDGCSSRGARGGRLSQSV